jgi:hypothetical protein
MIKFVFNDFFDKPNFVTSKKKIEVEKKRMIDFVTAKTV